MSDQFAKQRFSPDSSGKTSYIMIHNHNTNQTNSDTLQKQHKTHKLMWSSRETILRILKDHNAIK